MSVLHLVLAMAAVNNKSSRRSSEKGVHGAYVPRKAARCRDKLAFDLHYGMRPLVALTDFDAALRLRPDLVNAAEGRRRALALQQPPTLQLPRGSSP